MITKIVKCSSSEYSLTKKEELSNEQISDPEKIERLASNVVREILSAYERGESKKIFIEIQSVTSDREQPFSKHILLYGR